MSEDIRKVDTSSHEFKQGVEAGLNSQEDTKNWHACNKLGQELKNEGEKRGVASETLCSESSTSLFVENIRRGNKGNLQDEKDETEE
jgi:hypothetical protein